MVAFVIIMQRRRALKYRGLRAPGGGAAAPEFAVMNLGTVWVRLTTKKFKKAERIQIWMRGLWLVYVVFQTVFLFLVYCTRYWTIGNLVVAKCDIIKNNRKITYEK